MSHSFRQITPTDKFGWHVALLPVYELLFSKFCGPDADGDNKFVRLLEIGNDGGGGLLMYRDYFKNSHIFGIDISPTPEGIKGADRITHYVADAYAGPPTRIVGNTNFDIIIDDGSHFLDHQKLFVNFYPHLLTAEGLAIVEDIQKPEHIEELARCVPAGFFSFTVDVRHVEPKRYDNLIFCIQHL